MSAVMLAFSLALFQTLYCRFWTIMAVADVESGNKWKETPGGIRGAAGNKLWVLLKDRPINGRRPTLEKAWGTSLARSF
jgi:hypothetical protein